MQEEVALGSFVLGSVAGRGGMAEVFRAVHRPSNTAVAVKVLTASFARDARFVATLENEVRAIARINHPGVVRIFDYGTIDEGAAGRSQGLLLPGSPYLIMELASGGTLSRARLPMPWSELSAVLKFLLEALGHVHARGIVHRDLKPDNVLVCDGHDLRPGLRLTDFGIAKAREVDPDDRDRGGGTPQFMSPEQFCGRKTDAGPWTDLYSLGCIAHLFATGRLPFRGSGLELAMAHVSETPAPMGLGSDYPDDLEAWILRLLEKEPRRRFLRAADASHELAGISKRFRMKRGTGRAGDVSAPISVVFEDARTLLATSGSALQRSVSSSHLGTLPITAGVDLMRRWQDALERSESRPSLPPSAPPMPSDWRDPKGAKNSTLKGVGLGLFGLKEPPLVGRVRERDQLWSELERVHRERRPRTVVLSSAAGQGKSRLVDWLLTRSHELGVATPFRAGHAELPSPLDGIPAMIARHLFLLDASHEEAEGRIFDFLARFGEVDKLEARALADALGVSPRKRVFRNGRERHRLFEQVLTLEAQDRPVVVSLDDVQWGPDALAFVKAVMESQASNPVLFVLCVREDLLEGRAAERTAIEELLGQKNVCRLELKPLSHEETHELVEELLGLDPELSARVVARTHGNPLFAVQVIGDWVQRGVLRASEQGFVLTGEVPEVPDDIYAVWSARLKPVVEGRKEWVWALTCAAVLGKDVRTAEWQELCGRFNVPAPAELLERLAREDLIRVGEAAFSFVHVLLLESLLNAARRSGRFERIHREAGELLAERAMRMEPGFAERAGRHYALSDRSELAARWLLAGARERFYLCDYAALEFLLDEHDRLISGKEGSRDPRWVESLLLRAELGVRLGRFEAAREAAQAAARAAEDGRNRAEAERLCAVTFYELGDLERGWVQFHQAAQLFAEVGDIVGAERAHIGLGDVAYTRGDFQGARKAYEHALEALERIGAVEYVADALYGVGFVALWEKKYDESRRHFEREHAVFEAMGDRFGLARVSNSLGELSRLTGQWSEAERWYRRAMSLGDSLGLARVSAVTRLNLAQVALEQDRFDEAQRLVEDAQRWIASSGAVGLSASAIGVQFVVIANKREYASLPGLAEELERVLAATNRADGDVAMLMERATKMLAAQGSAAAKAVGQWTERIARAQWTALGRSDKLG